MATWKKYFKTHDINKAANSGGNYGHNSGAAANTSKSVNKWLPEVYQGQPNRVQRYSQFDMMDLDSEINAALDIIAEFSTLQNEENGLPFKLDYPETPTDSESEVLTNTLQQWIAMNEMSKRIFRIFRNAIKYGDQIFVRDPETYKLFWVNPSNVEKIVVNEGKGKKKEAYFIRDMDLNLQSMNITANSQKLSQAGISPVGSANSPTTTVQQVPSSAVGSSGRFTKNENTTTVDAKHIVHLSLNEGVDAFWPFGNSILEPIFKVFKQKELLEDALLIYRVQRAPERRVFYIDTGSMPTHKANQHLERIKNQIHQRRIPTRNADGNTIMDSTYNPLSIMEDFFFAQTAEGRGSKVETLPGGENLGQIDDLKYFNNKLTRGLRVPSSYLPTGPEDGTATFNDGRVGTAMIQEYRFGKFVERLQSLVIEELDREFKMFCKHRGVEVEASTFSIKFNEPQNFSKYRQIELDNTAMQVFTGMAEAPFISTRFAMKRYLGLTDDEIIENEKLLMEEMGENDNNPEDFDGLKAAGAAPSPGGMPGGEDFDFDDEDMDMGGDEGTESPISGAENASDDDMETPEE